MQSSSDLTEFLRTQTYVAFDTETTGLWAPVNRLVEIAGVKFRLGQVEPEESFASLINPERPIPEDVVAIHGITDAMVAAAPTARAVLERFVAFCDDDSILIAHNAPFDISFVHCELGRLGLPYPENVILDTVDIYRRLHPGLESYSLLSLVSRFEIARTQEHRALSDAILVQGLFAVAASGFGDVCSVDALKSRFATYSLATWPGEEGELPPEFSELTRAIKESRRVEIIYQSPSQREHTRVIQPKQVYILGSMYYINAFCERAHGERTFRLDRIEQYQVID
ncbi:MAG TPA: exonuclease domain-containing protein [Candidatus Deferrimicrobium sp.]|nr:exonuclease domain-containing protein [Candidatus Deferrimicrobium sp.]